MVRIVFVRIVVTPRGVILLLGGGFSLSEALSDSGFTLWMGNRLTALSDMNVVLICLIVCLITNVLANICSHTAVANIMFPIVAMIAKDMYDERSVHPFVLMIPCSLANTATFLTPYGTPPNSLAFATHRVSAGDFLRHGTPLNLISLMFFSVVVPFIVPWFFGVGQHF